MEQGGLVEDASSHN